MQLTAFGKAAVAILKTTPFPPGKPSTKTWRIMKITAFLLFVACLQVTAVGYTQRITLHETRAPLEKIFKEIRRQTGMNFLFSSEQLRKADLITINVKDATIEEILQICLKGQAFSYSIEN